MLGGKNALEQDKHRNLPKLRFGYLSIREVLVKSHDHSSLPLSVHTTGNHGEMSLSS